MQQDGGLNMELDDKRTYRIAFGADFTVPYLEGWEGTAFYAPLIDQAKRYCQPGLQLQCG